LHEDGRLFQQDKAGEGSQLRWHYESLVTTLVVRNLLLSDVALRLRQAYDPPKSRRKGETQMLNIKVWMATLAVWMGMSFTLCVLGGVLVPGLPIRHQTLELLLPGFTWISLGSFVLGLAESLFYGVYVSVVLVAVHNFFHRRWVGTH
jgi:hypothetical protein